MALARYEGVAQDRAGNVIPNATVEVRRDQPGRPVVPLFGDRDGAMPIGNPITTDSLGKFAFHAPGGVYYIRVYTGPSQAPFQEHVRRYQAIGTAAERDIEELTADLGAATEAAVAAKEAAEVAQTAAEEAASVAQLSAGVFDDTADGLANTSDGDYFSVPSASSGEYLILYRNNSGTAQQVETYPSAAKVHAIEAQVGPLHVVALPPESGYVWGLADQNGRAVLLVSVDGAVSGNFDFSARLPEELSNDSGYVWAITDENDAVALGIRNDGRVAGNFYLPFLTPNQHLWCLGDSLTAGAGGQVTWREVVETALPNRTVTNAGIGGQTSSEIAARAGAYLSLLTVSGDEVPASGAVAVTSRTINLLTDQGQQSINGWLAGIYGTLARAGDDTYSFTRTAAGEATYCAPGEPFVPDVQGHDHDTTIIFIGRNNIGSPEDIKRDIAASVANIKTAEKRFLIITPPNGGSTSPGVSTTEGVGSSVHANIVEIETWAVQTYGDRVLRSRPFSWQFNDGSDDDLDDVAKGTVPRSLRIDFIHWTTAFHAHVGAWVLNEISRRNW